MTRKPPRTFLRPKPPAKPYLILIVPSVGMAEAISIDAKAWIAGPTEGMGELSIVMGVSGDIKGNPDAAWIEAQIIIGGVGTITPANILWGAQETDE